jgi:hypothetical protein
MKGTTTIALLTLALTSGCSKVKDFENKTASMEKTTKEMSSTTNEMKSTTTTMYQQVRSKEAEDTRSKKFDLLLNEDNNFGAKFAASAVYFKSFEFQLWNADVQYEDAHSREELFLDAVNEFTRRVSDIYEEIDTHKMSPTKTGSSHNFEMAFYSLGATMHFNHAFQEDLARDKNIPTISFYDLVKKSLLKDLNGQSLEDYEVTLVSGMNKEIMIELIKARVDILTALALKDLTDKRNMTIGQKAKALLFQITGGRIGAIDLPETYDSTNTATKMTVETRLEGAMKARNFLKEIGVSKDLEKTLSSALFNIDFNEQNPKPSKVQDKHKDNIKFLINNLLS